MAQPEPIYESVESDVLQIFLEALQENLGTAANHVEIAGNQIVLKIGCPLQTALKARCWADGWICCEESFEEEDEGGGEPIAKAS